MNNFQYYNPTKILFGIGQTAKISKYIPRDAKVLMTYGGGSIFKNGVYDQVKEALNGFNVIEFGGIEANPQYHTLMKAVELVKKEKITFLLAVGGGSVLDGTKFIAAASLFEGDAWDICKKHAPITQSLPLASIMTIPATGSEMNNGGVISREETKEKFAFSSAFSFPKFSVLDPSFTKSLPARQRANGVVDTFVHTIEQYLTYPVNAPLQEKMGEAIFSTLIENGKQYVEHPEDMDTAATIVWAATVGLNYFFSVGVPQDWSTHMIGHELTAYYGLDHAQTLAIVLPGLMQVMRAEKREMLLRFAKNVWHIEAGSEDQKIDMAIEKTNEFFNSLGVGTRLSDYNLGEKAANEIAESLQKKGMTALGEKGAVTPEKVCEILKTRV